jgi:hypothetical protein
LRAAARREDLPGFAVASDPAQEPVPCPPVLHRAGLGHDGGMADRYRTPGGWTVEIVRLGEACDPAGDRLRIRHHGFYVADVRSVAALADWIPPGELELLERDPLSLAA